MTEQQRRHFDTFGYLVLPGFVADDIAWITEEFEAVFRDRGVVHDGTKRSCIVPFIDQRERLSTLLDHPRLQELIGGLLGDDFIAEKACGSCPRVSDKRFCFGELQLKMLVQERSNFALTVISSASFRGPLKPSSQSSA